MDIEDDESIKDALDNSKNSTPVPVKLEPSKDLDLTNVKTKPLPREPGEPTYRGWKEVVGWQEEDALTPDDEIVDLLMVPTILDGILPAYAFGDWYHNVGLLIVGALLSWIIGWFRFSLAPLFFVILVFTILYRTSIKKYRTVLRTLAQREFSVKSIEDDYETMDWANTFMDKFWVYLEPSVSQIVCEQVNPILATAPIPGFVKKLWIDSFTAGTKPPRIDLVKTVQGTNSDIVVMDWGFSFTPNSLSDSNNKQMKNNVNQKIIVKANLFGIPIPVAVSDVSFKAMARIRMRMMTSFPHIETVNVSLLEAPQFDFKCKLLGDSIFNWEVLAFPGLYPFINEMIKKYVGAMVFAPLSFQLNVQQLLSGNALDSAIGVLAISCNSARGLKGFSVLGNTLDPYLNIGFKNTVLATTKTKDDTDTPTWKEVHYIPVKSLSEPLNITVVDSNDFRTDKDVGTIQFDLECLLENPKQPNLTAAFVRNSKPVGELNFGLHFMPTLESVKQADGAIIPPPDLNTGITRIEIIEARHLKSGTDKAASTYAELYVNSEKMVTTGVQKNTNTPGWGASHEHIVGNRRKTKVKVLIKDKNDKLLGQVNSSLLELIDATMVEQSWFPLSRGGEVRITANWKPVELVNASGAGGYTPPIGVVRISLDNASDLRNLERIGKVDPYARVLVNGFQRARTAAADSTLNPTWNEVLYFTVSSANQKLTIDVMDVESHSPDRTLGAFDVKLQDIIKKDEKGQYIEHVDSKKRKMKLIHKEGPKGSVTFSLSFYPTLPVLTLDEIKEQEEAKEKAKKEKEEKAKKEQEEKDKNPDGSKKTSKDKKEEEQMDKEAQEDEEEEISSKLHLPLDELIEYKSGVFIYEISEGTLSKDDVYLQAFFDNHGHCDYVSQELRKKQLKIGNTGDVIIKELDWSKANFRVVKKKGANRADKAVAETTLPTIQLLKNYYNNAGTIDLNGNGEAHFKIQCSWVPIIYEGGVPPQDSINNSGILYVDVLRAENLIASDRNGKSDPYVQLFLNTDKEYFFKSKKIKKTLDPTWNESAEVEVLNKHDSVLKVVCYDWDMGPEKDDLLGIGYINLSDVVTGETTELSCKLVAEDGGDGGVAYFSFSFKPEFILNVKHSSTTHIGDTFGTVGNVGLGAGKGVAKGVGKGLTGGLSGVKSLTKGFHRGKD